MILNLPHLRAFSLWAVLPLLLTSCASSSEKGILPAPRTISSPAASGPISLIYSSQLLAPQVFASHVGSKAFQSYLAMNVDFASAAELRELVENQVGKKLLHREEAHITIVTPPEFDLVLSQKLSMSEINELALAAGLQSLSFQPVCVGRWQLAQTPISETYYVVVKSPPLLALRQKIEKLFRSRGGKRGAFQAELFFPHITLGYTVKDLHYEDGARKDETSCVFGLHE